MTAPELLVTGEGNPSRLILAHGAGAPMDSDFMNEVAEGLAGSGIQVVRFEFPYMAERRATGKKRGPNSQRQLLESYRAAIQAVGEPGRLVIGGKSMGGRMASMIADEMGVAGVVCLGYPFHPPGSPDKLRTEHLKSIATPMLVVQGERDTFGTRDEIPGFGLDPKIQFEWLPDGDHSFKPRKKSGHTLAENMAACIGRVVTFVGSL